MHRLQELVRLHRMGTGKREIARLLAISPTTERQYRQALSTAGLLAGAVEDLPDLAVLQAAVRDGATAEDPAAAGLVDRGVDGADRSDGGARGPSRRRSTTACGLQEPTFAGSLSAVKRLVARLKAARAGGARGRRRFRCAAAPGEIAQVDFGYVGRLYDPAGRRAAPGLGVRDGAGLQPPPVCARGVRSTHGDLAAAARRGVRGASAAWWRPWSRTISRRRWCARPSASADDPALNRSYASWRATTASRSIRRPPRAPGKERPRRVGGEVREAQFLSAPRLLRRRRHRRSMRSSTAGCAEIAGQRRHGTTGQRPLEVFAARGAAGAAPAAAHAVRTGRVEAGPGPSRRPDRSSTGGSIRCRGA